MTEGRWFGERHGYEAVREALQIGEIDDRLRTRLWNVIDGVYLAALGKANGLDDFRRNERARLLFHRLWDQFFGWPIDTLKGYWDLSTGPLRDTVLGEPWTRVYGLLEALVEFCPYAERDCQTVVRLFNDVLEAEKSGYRLIDGRIVQITSEAEVQAIEAALADAGPYAGVAVHLRRALELLSDRDTPDYRNSIKESISAVESACRALTDSPNATLGKALDALASAGLGMHPALKGAFEKLYGYTSDEDGIRHALLEESDLGHEDALFMLVACSAFTNLLKVKGAALGTTS